MEQYIPKSALVAEIERMKDESLKHCKNKFHAAWSCATLDNLLYFLNTLEVKEVDEQKERVSECPYRQVGCTMYEGHILECKGACSWVVDYPTLKRLKAQKGE